MFYLTQSSSEVYVINELLVAIRSALNFNFSFKYISFLYIYTELFLGDLNTLKMATTIEPFQYFCSRFLDTQLFYLMDRRRIFFVIWFHKNRNLYRLLWTVISCISFTNLRYAMVYNFNEMLCDFNAMLWNFYAMRNCNEDLNDMVCYDMLWHAMKFEQKRLVLQKGSKHFKVKW